MQASERGNSLTMPSLLHNHPEFIELLRIVADDLKISPVLVEKDYWIMHSLWGLQQMGLVFQLKGGYLPVQRLRDHRPFFRGY